MYGGLLAAMHERVQKAHAHKPDAGTANVRAYELSSSTVSRQYRLSKVG